MFEVLLIDALLLLLVVMAVAMIEVRNLFASAMLLSVYSLLMALIWLNMDAVDVSFTEAAVGAGISTILLIGTLVQVGSEEKRAPRVHWPGLIFVAATAALLIYGTLDMPRFGKPDAPIHRRVAPEYITQTAVKEGGGKHGKKHEEKYEEKHAEGPHDYFHGHVPNKVTAVIVTYRAYDTMFEAAVIFTAGVGMILLLRRRREDRGVRP